MAVIEFKLILLAFLREEGMLQAAYYYYIIIA